MKYANDTNIIGHINNYLVVHRKPFTVQQTKKLVVDLMKKKAKTHTPDYISKGEVEQMYSFKFLGINIIENIMVMSHHHPS